MTTTMTPEQYANENLTRVLDKYEDPFFLPSAELSLVAKSGKVLFCETAGDIYQLLDLDVPTKIDRDDIAGVTLATCGWAAPINAETGEAEGAPSQHPERRRVLLSLFANGDGTTSAMLFQDADRDSVIFDTNEASGPLAEAVREFIDRI